MDEVRNAICVFGQAKPWTLWRQLHNHKPFSLRCKALA
jgi:hypothetical protein